MVWGRGLVVWMEGCLRPVVTSIYSIIHWNRAEDVERDRCSNERRVGMIGDWQSCAGAFFRTHWQFDRAEWFWRGERGRPETEFDPIDLSTSPEQIGDSHESSRLVVPTADSLSFCQYG